jgi:hypothetical protein
MSVWYVAHNDELLIDLDEYMRPTKTGCPWGEAFFRRRLRDAMAAGKLKVEEVWLVNSTSEKHYHAIVRIEPSWGKTEYIDTPRWSPTDVERLVWQLHLGSDLYRGRADLMRLARNVYGPSLLIRHEKIENFYREPDAICDCTGKHDTEKQHALGDDACPIWQHYRGMSPWELFGPSRKLTERFVALPTGQVPLELIMKVEAE